MADCVVHDDLACRIAGINAVSLLAHCHCLSHNQRFNTDCGNRLICGAVAATHVYFAALMFDALLR